MLRRQATPLGGRHFPHGALIAIIVVVVVVAAIGSEFRIIHLKHTAIHYESTRSHFPPARSRQGHVPTNIHIQKLAGSAVLFYLTKKKEWKLREKMRRSAKRMVTALTPRRSEFPNHLKEGAGRGKGQRNVKMRADDVPPTPRFRPDDLEKSADGPDQGGGKKKKLRWPGH